MKLNEKLRAEIEDHLFELKEKANLIIKEKRKGLGIYQISLTIDDCREVYMVATWGHPTEKNHYVYEETRDIMLGINEDPESIAQCVIELDNYAKRGKNA